jgi:hypothetical protein
LLLPNETVLDPVISSRLFFSFGISSCHRDHNDPLLWASYLVVSFSPCFTGLHCGSVFKQNFRAF